MIPGVKKYDTDAITVYELYGRFHPARQWLEETGYDRHHELVALVLDWAFHWDAPWSTGWSASQLARVAVIGDWLEERGGDREWATALTPMPPGPPERTGESGRESAKP